MSQQGLRQASVRAESGTTLTYEGDWHALWDGQDIEAGTFNERMLIYCAEKLGTTFTNINDAMQALAMDQGATNFGSMGTFDASISGGGPPVLVSDGVLLTAATNKLEIRDTVTPANDYNDVPGAKIVTTRASTAYCYNSSGVLTQVAVNTSRLDYDPRLGSNAPGYLGEDVRTNYLLWSNDLTNVAWVKTDITPVKDQTGPDGVANSASKITATAANATVLQTLVIASSLQIVSAFVKRLVGSGTVEMTTDGGTLWTPVTVTASWTRVEIPAQTLANPSIGFRIATSGDSIAVWCVQDERVVGGPTSPIPTTTALTTRALDVHKLASSLFPLNLSDGQGTLYVKAMFAIEPPAVTQFMVSLDDGTIAEQAALSRPGATKKINATLRDGNVSQIAQASVSAYAGLGPVKVAVGFKLNDTNTVFAVEALTATDTSCTMPTPNTLVFCNQSATGSSSLSGWLLEAMYLPTRLTDAQLAELTA